MLANACHTPLEELDGAYYAWDDRAVHCSVEIDDRAGVSIEQILAGMDRAKQTGEVLELLVHIPGETMTLDRLEAVLAGARERSLPFLTVTEILRGPAMAGVAIMYDDWRTLEWVDSMDTLAEYDAHVTLYIAHYAVMQPEAKQRVALLAAAGHDIEAHGVKHLRGPTYVEQHGVRAYVEEEALPSIDVLRADGYEVLSYAYPFGMRTSEMDDAILDTGSVEMLRSLARTYQWRADSCPH